MFGSSYKIATVWGIPIKLHVSLVFLMFWFWLHWGFVNGTLLGIGLLTSIALHELGHKLVSNYFGFPAGFSYSKQGLIFALIISLLFGVAVGLPGAVLIYGRPDKRENGLISAAGPLTNLLVGILFIIPGIVTLVIGLQLIGTGLVFVALINFFIGTFNMIPLMPFDGAKIWKWNPFIYLLLLFFLAPPVVFYFMGGF